MVRGTTTFICDKCGHTFKALDIEYLCTALSCPQECPNCGSYHTMPAGLGGLFGDSAITKILSSPKKLTYKSIWKEMDK